MFKVEVRAIGNCADIYTISFVLNHLFHPGREYIPALLPDLNDISIQICT
jgi:hypothetical protein